MPFTKYLMSFVSCKLNTGPLSCSWPPQQLLIIGHPSVSECLTLITQQYINVFFCVLPEPLFLTGLCIICSLNYLGPLRKCKIENGSWLYRFHFFEYLNAYN